MGPRFGMVREDKLAALGCCAVHRNRRGSGFFWRCGHDALTSLGRSMESSLGACISKYYKMLRQFTKLATPWWPPRRVILRCVPSPWELYALEGEQVLRKDTNFSQSCLRILRDHCSQRESLMPTDAPPQGDPIWIDWTNACVWRGGEAVHLTPKAFAVLRTLTARAGQLVLKVDLLEAVWPEAVVSEAVLTECIRELRQALGETARVPRWIQTVHRRGYRFLGPAPGLGPGAWERPAAGPATPPLRGALGSPVLALGTTAVVGRAAEMTQLHERPAQARGGARQVVFITGEPGIGKTTLVQAFVAEV